MIIAEDGFVKNRIGKTQAKLIGDSEHEKQSLVNEHEFLTIMHNDDGNIRKRKGCFLINCCRMCNYRKIVTQKEQYDINMRTISNWKQKTDERLYSNSYTVSFNDVVSRKNSRFPS